MVRRVVVAAYSSGASPFSRVRQRSRPCALNPALNMWWAIQAATSLKLDTYFFIQLHHPQSAHPSTQSDVNNVKQRQLPYRIYAIQ